MVASAFYLQCEPALAAGTPSSSCPANKPAATISAGNAAVDQAIGQAFEANNTFRADYAGLRSAILRDLGPVIITDGGKAILLDDGIRQEVAYIPDRYEVIKTIDHMPLGVFVVLEPSTRALNYAVTPSTVNTLQALQKEIILLRKAIKGSSHSALSIVRQLEILDTTDNFINKVIEAGHVTKSQLNRFCRGLTPYLIANAYDDVEIEIGNLNKIVAKWLQAMPVEKRKQLHVIVMDIHMAHKDNRIQQYFFKVLGEHEEGHRLVYVESCCNEKQALDLLATHVLDAKIGEAFFGDPMRMHRDLLAQVAKVYLERHQVASAR
jgi:hypothetical protein